MINKLHKKKLIDHSMQVRYERAQILLQGIWTQKVAFNDTVYPIWIKGTDFFWYERTKKSKRGGKEIFGKEYRLVDANAGTNQLAFDHSVFAVSLTAATANEVNPINLPIGNVELTLNPLTIKFTAFDKQWIFDSQTEICSEDKLIKDHWLVSPDGNQAVFCKDHNLIIRNLTSGEERALTSDGCKNYSYGAAPTATGIIFDTSALPQASWSPDGEWIFAVQRDSRDVKDFPILYQCPKDGCIRPQVQQVKLALPGDEDIETMHIIMLHVRTGRMCKADHHPIPVYALGTGFFTEGKAWWGSDSQRAYFIDMERGYKSVRVIEIMARTGVTRVLFEESSETQINLCLHLDDHPSFMPLPDSEEILWFSERSGWAHLYLYDLKQGRLKHAVTQGEWLVRRVVSYDSERREVYVQTAGRGANLNRDPYYCDLVRVNIDTRELTTLAASDHDYYVVSPKNFNSHIALDMGRDIKNSNGVSPNGNFAVVTKSRANTVPVSLLLDRVGNEILQIEVADVSGLPSRWQWPEPVKLEAADGKTDIFGLVFRPSDFSPEKIYPVVSHVMNVADSPWVSKGSFSNGECLNWTYLDAAALAELGFIVVQIDGRGSACRHKAFQDESYGNYCSGSSLDDHVAGIRQLAKRYSYMDLDRVGITCHLSGGSAGVLGLVEHPDFYKVGVNGCLHDPRLMASSCLVEKYEGLDAPRYQPLEDRVKSISGKLFIAQGLLDVTAPPAAMLRVIEAMQIANKDFEMILMPNVGHASSPDYLTRRVWDFLVTHLLEIAPPKAFKLNSFAGGYEVTKCDGDSSTFNLELY